MFSLHPLRRSGIIIYLSVVTIMVNLPKPDSGKADEQTRDEQSY